MVMSLQDKIHFFTYQQVREIISYIARHYTHANTVFMHPYNDPLYPCRSCIVNGICHPVVVRCSSTVIIISAISEGKGRGNHNKSCERGRGRIIKVVFFPI